VSLILFLEGEMGQNPHQEHLKDAGLAFSGLSGLLPGRKVEED